jgi:hypothetical protein
MQIKESVFQFPQEGIFPKAVLVCQNVFLTLIYPLPSKQVDSYQKVSLPPSQIGSIQEDFDLSFIKKDIGSTNKPAEVQNQISS